MMDDRHLEGTAAGTRGPDAMLKKFARLTGPASRSVGSVTLSIRIWTVSASTGSSSIGSNGVLGFPQRLQSGAGGGKQTPGLHGRAPSRSAAGAKTSRICPSVTSYT